MNRKKRILVLSAAAVMAVALTTGWTVPFAALRASFAGDGWPPQQMEVYSTAGAWSITSPQWPSGVVGTLVLSPEDPRTGRYSWVGGPVNMDPTLNGLFPDAEAMSQWSGTGVRTASDECQVTGILYATKKNQPCDIVTWIWVSSETNKWIDADTLSCEGTCSYYSAVEHPGHMLGDLPDQDLNDDGLPDEGQEPVFCVPYTGLLRRINLMPPCTPTPMPGPGQQ
jgi:hypothetical protein